MKTLTKKEAEQLIKELAKHRGLSEDHITAEIQAKIDDIWHDEMVDQLCKDSGKPIILKTISIEQYLTEMASTIHTEIDACKKIKEKKIRAFFNSTGKTEIQVLRFLLEESQKLIDEAGIEVNFTKVVSDCVQYKVASNLINVIWTFIDWHDEAGVYFNPVNIINKPLKVAKIIDLLMRENPNALVAIEYDRTASVVKFIEGGYMLKNEEEGYLLAEDDFHPNVKDKMVEIVTFNAPFNANKEAKGKKRITSYVRYFGSTRQPEVEGIKWLYKSTKDLMDDLELEIDLAPLLKPAEDYESALKVLRQYVDWRDLDGKFVEVC